MKIAPIILTAALFSTAAFAQNEPVPLENGKSPDGRFEVVLEADKDTPGYEKYEMKGGSYPAFLILDQESGKALVRIEFPGDVQSDQQPLRKHTKILWSPKSSAVAINTDERFYSHLTLAAFDEESGVFKKVIVPDYMTLTGFPDPPREQLRARGREFAEGWTEDGHLIYRLRYAPMPSFEGDDPLRHRIELAVESDGFKVVRRLPLEETE